MKGLIQHLLMGPLVLAGAIHSGCSSGQAGRQISGANGGVISIAPFKAFDTPCLSAADPDVASSRLHQNQSFSEPIGRAI